VYIGIFNIDSIIEEAFLFFTGAVKMERKLLWTMTVLLAVFPAVPSFAADLLKSGPAWNIEKYEGNSLTVAQSSEGTVMDFRMPVQGQWVQIWKELDKDAKDPQSLVFSFQYKGPGQTLEVKLVDDDGSTFGKKIELLPVKIGWSDIILPVSDLSYFWGGDKTLGHIVRIYFAVAGTGDGTLTFRSIGLNRGPAGGAAVSGQDVSGAEEPDVDIAGLPPSKFWNNPKDWILSGDNDSTVKITSVKARLDYGLKIRYSLRKGAYGFVEFRKNIPEKFDPAIPVVFWIKAKADSDLEIKFVDNDGSIFIRKVPLKDAYKDWTRVVIYLNSTEYGWGGKNDEFDGWGFFQFAISGSGQGTVYLDGIGFGEKGMKASFGSAGPMIDPNAALPGTGFRQRRDAVMNPEDPLVLEGLRQIQDISSPGRQILPSMENNEAQTFNNALVAMAFLVKGERGRAERLLDFYAAATDRGNQEINRQNFYYNGEARGFYQWVELNATEKAGAFHFDPAAKSGPDRWMGDMAWLLIAYKNYEKQFNSRKYAVITGILKDYLVSLYTNASEAPGGYLRHGWINGDRKHNENFGHPEGNIDAWVAMKLCGEDRIAGNIRTWLDTKLKGKTLPLDLYTWRVLAYGSSFSNVLNIPEYDLRYRKILDTKAGRKAMGFYPFANYNVNNIWFDGTGHITCAYYAVGNPLRGNFYSNQLDAFLIDCKVNNVLTRSLPYTANTTGEYPWVDVKKGFISAAAWYIFAKNRYNPYWANQGPAK
jgi:hypothetical protein